MSASPLKALLEPTSVAVVGASPRGRSAGVIQNLRDCGFSGTIYGVNPRYQDVFGYRCVAAVADLPPDVECLVVALGADAACDALEQAHARGIPAAIVLAAGFGEGGHGQARAARIAALAGRGMSICGPNCFGLINFKRGVAAFSGTIPKPPCVGSVALVSQSGGLAAAAFTALMDGRGLGFSHVVSCGNQLGATIEDFVEYCVADPDVRVVAILVEALKNPQKLVAVAARAAAERKSLLLYQVGRSAAGQIMIRSHTGAIAGNREVVAAFLRGCGIVQANDFDEFVETIELFATAPRDTTIADDIVVLSGSGGAAAMVTDALEEAKLPLAQFEPETVTRLRATQPDFASVTNPIDGTGAMYDDPELLPEIFAALVAERQRPVIAVSVTVRAGTSASVRRLANTLAVAASASDRTFVTFQYTPLGGPLDNEIVSTLRAAGIPVLLGTGNAMRALRHLPTRRSYWLRPSVGAAAALHPSVTPIGPDFLAARRALTEFGIPVVEAALAASEDEAVALQRGFAAPVAIKAEVPELLHKSDIGCVQLGCDAAAAVAQAYRTVIANARAAGFPTANQVLVQPMVSGVAEVYAGIIDSVPFGPAICFGLGGIFVEIIGGAKTEMAPLTLDEALALIRSVAGAQILTGARGRPSGDLAALADLLVRFGDFALAHAGRYRSIDLNPIIVKPKGVIAVDIAIDTGRDIATEKP